MSEGRFSVKHVLDWWNNVIWVQLKEENRSRFSHTHSGQPSNVEMVKRVSMPFRTLSKFKSLLTHTRWWTSMSRREFCTCFKNIPLRKIKCKSDVLDISSNMRKNHKIKTKCGKKYSLTLICCLLKGVRTIEQFALIKGSMFSIQSLPSFQNVRVRHNIVVVSPWRAALQYRRTWSPRAWWPGRYYQWSL